ncbi:hypothetical protein [Micromonospora sp. CA-248212]|uniref:hypothetical protein n=1 Tax=Micromonospora sp. CA-248212 TaxID=3239961 RepID=UPI003D93791C
MAAVALAAGVFLVAATVAVLLAGSAVLDLYWDPQAAVVQAIVAVWVAQTPVLAWLFGRRTRADRRTVVLRLRAEITDLRAEGERKDARIAALEDERSQWWESAHGSRWADDDRLLPDTGDRPDWASINRKNDTTTTTAAGTSLPAAVSHP